MTLQASQSRALRSGGPASAWRKVVATRGRAKPKGAITLLFTLRAISRVVPGGWTFSVRRARGRPRCEGLHLFLSVLDHLAGDVRLHIIRAFLCDTSYGIVYFESVRLDFLCHRWAAWSSMLAERGPVVAEALAPPSNHGRRFN
ncbi:MAG: hypothetical protein ACREXR_12035 [Gammaproteobacteria bacterium]